MKYNPDIHHRRSIRLKGYDYSQAGYYFITICCADRACLFGNIIDDSMYLNDFGIIAHDEWLKTVELRKNVLLDDFVIMPNHMHAIIILTETDLSEEYNGSSISELGVCNTPLRSPSNNLGSIIRGYKSAVTKQIKQQNFHGQVWQRNYHEHIIRNEQSYQKISQYIANNPTTWNEDCFYI
ncbi:transposase [Acinetobacter puyangensis]|uniref:REP element-mobilizing transposase RayT n=1 Tax=Acinetobacter puyangensis TaxID=1096779 RepID=A0A240E7P2_9GAMM|nr:transposase [Acinetobacter puyangensis]SNX44541.1 REP element-mobilizing transposase RayT [Acinetobacter puyangensis]